MRGKSTKNTHWSRRWLCSCLKPMGFGTLAVSSEWSLSPCQPSSETNGPLFLDKSAPTAACRSSLTAIPKSFKLHEGKNKPLWRGRRRASLKSHKLARKQTIVGAKSQWRVWKKCQKGKWRMKIVGRGGKSKGNIDQHQSVLLKHFNQHRLIYSMQSKLILTESSCIPSYSEIISFSHQEGGKETSEKPSNFHQNTAFCFLPSLLFCLAHFYLCLLKDLDVVLFVVPLFKRMKWTEYFIQTILTKKMK